MQRVEVRDPVHGLVRLRPIEWKLIDSAAFQRLRRIQQLAMTHLVYPGARHSRFEHSIGACSIAGRIAEQIGMSQEDTEVVRIAALVHDIGHGPFSHVSEEISNRHEEVSGAIVAYDDEICDVLGTSLATRISELLTETGSGSSRSLERDVIAGPADVDKFDYLLRDSRFCGVEYGTFDLDKLIESSRRVDLVRGHSALGFHSDAVYALEELLLARHHMHRQVYGHRTRIATDRMLVRAMRLALDEDVLPLEAFCPTDDLDERFVSHFLKWDDAEVSRRIRDASGTRSCEVMEALTNRKLLKRAARFSYADVARQFSEELAGYICDPGPDVVDEVSEAESLVASACGLQPHWVCFVWEDLKNPLSGRPSVRVDEREIILVDDEGRTRRFASASEIFQETDFAAPNRFVSIYIRPPEDEELSEETKARVSGAALEGLEAIGSAAARI